MTLIDKKKIAQSFGLAAETYDAVAHFQRWVGERLLENLPQIKADTVLDLGCGTGYFSDALSERFPEAHCLGLDLSEQMLLFASKHHTNACNWVVGDAEMLPLQSGAIDLIYSSLAIQWCASLPGLMQEISRVLKPGGVFVFSTLLDGTLFELKQAWSAVDDKQHVNDFFSEEAYLQAVRGTELTLQVISQETKVLTYQKLSDLTRELKGLGAHNLNSARTTTLTGKRKLIALIAEYDKFRMHSNLLPASYELLFAVLSKPLSGKMLEERS